MTRPDRFDRAIGICQEPSLRIIAGQVDRDRLVPSLLKERHDAMPVPCNSASTRNENEAGQVCASHGAQPPLSQMRKEAVRQAG